MYSSGLDSQLHERQSDRKDRAAVALGRDLAAVRFDQLFDEREADAEAAVPSGRRAVGLTEAVPDVRQKFRRDAFAVVLDLDGNPARGFRHVVRDQYPVAVY